MVETVKCKAGMEPLFHRNIYSYEFPPTDNPHEDVIQDIVEIRETVLNGTVYKNNGSNELLQSGLTIDRTVVIYPSPRYKIERNNGKPVTIIDFKREIGTRRSPFDNSKTSLKLMPQK